MCWKGIVTGSYIVLLNEDCSPYSKYIESRFSHILFLLNLSTARANYLRTHYLQGSMKYSLCI